jgi:glucokinase
VKAVGIDIGGTQIKAVLVTDSGEVLRREVRPTQDDGSDARPWAGTVRQLADELGSKLPVGISAPGLAARDRRSIAVLPQRLCGIEGLDWTSFLTREVIVPVSNDAHASLRGEAWIGAARDAANALLLTLGTGVGGAILADGRILHGHLGRAGHLGHTCLDLQGEPSIAGTPGALETFIGNYNIAARSGGRFTSTHELLSAVSVGDEAAVALWRRSLHALGCATVSFINIVDPEVVIIGGGIATAGDLLFGPLRENVARHEWRPAGNAVKIIPAALGEWAGAIGAARDAMLRVPAFHEQPAPPFLTST